MPSYTILGITGRVGAAAASRLLASGVQVRAVVRNETGAARWQGLGAEAFVGDLKIPGPLKAAFRDVDGVFVMTPPWFETEDMFAENAAALEVLGQALRGARPTKVVLLSSIGAQHASGTGAILKLHAMEQAFADLPSVTSIRAGWFMENYAGIAQQVRDSGVLPSMLQPLHREVPMIATADIGALAADFLRSDWSGRRLLEVEGPRRYSPNDVAAAFARILGRTIAAQALPVFRWDATFRSWGLTPRSAEAMSEMLHGFNSGLIAYENKPAKILRAPTPLEDVLPQFFR